MVLKVSANFGDDWSPRHPRKYKESALFVAKSLRGNFNLNFRCVFHRYSPRARCILFEYVVTPLGGKPEVAIEPPSSKLALLCSLFRFEMCIRVHLSCIVMHVTCILMHTTRIVAHVLRVLSYPHTLLALSRASLALRCTFLSAPCLSEFDIALSICC